MSAALALKTAAFIFAAVVLTHWLTAGHDEIIEGPPETPGSSSIQSNR